ncbi:MAG: ComEC family competence protein [Patescibacteria group bacterium]|nr:ComEC family competence protein [Patescibacteria group bacterium]
MTKSQAFIAVCASFSAGVFLSSWLKIDAHVTALLLGLSIMVLSLGLISRRPLVFLPALLLFAGSWGVLRLQGSLMENEYANLLDAKQDLDGLIVEDPDIRQDRQLLTFQPEGFGQRILITTSKAQEYFYGDKLVVTGKPREPKAYEDFDYQKYLERYEVYAIMSYPKILVTRTGQGNWVKFQLLKLKQALVKNLSEKFTEPHASLLLGILIGAKKTLPQDLVVKFQATGLSHIVAVSGYNITILASFLGLAAYLLGRRASFWFSLLAIFAFAVIAGWSASVVRAAIMGAVLLVGFRSGRPYSAGPGICLAAGVMVAFNPRVLYWDAGFQLSFLATLGIVYVLPILEKLFRLEAGAAGLKAAALSSLAAILATLPLSLLHFGQLPVYALLANILVLPVVPYAMLFGFLALVPFLGPGFGFVAKLILDYMLAIIGWVASWPGAVWKVSVAPAAVLAVYLFLLAAFFWALRKTRPG